MFFTKTCCKKITSATLSLVSSDISRTSLLKNGDSCSSITSKWKRSDIINRRFQTYVDSGPIQPFRHHPREQPGILQGKKEGRIGWGNYQVFTSKTDHNHHYRDIPSEKIGWNFWPPGNGFFGINYHHWTWGNAFWPFLAPPDPWGVSGGVWGGQGFNVTSKTISIGILPLLRSFWFFTWVVCYNYEFGSGGAKNGQNAFPQVQWW